MYAKSEENIICYGNLCLLLTCANFDTADKHAVNINNSKHLFDRHE